MITPDDLKRLDDHREEISRVELTEDDKEQFNSRMTGYRYSVDVDDNIYIIRVSAESYEKNIFDYDSCECICESITNANTGVEVNQAELCGYMNQKIRYKVGEKIPGKCWFFLHYDDLFRSYLKKNGDRIVLAKPKLLHMNGKVGEYLIECGCTKKEVADDLQITEKELSKMIQLAKTLKPGFEQTRISAKILVSINHVYSRKLENGEIIPGWKKILTEGS